MDNEYLAAASTEHKAVLWKLKTMRQMHTFPGHKETINACKFSFVTKSLMTGSQDRTIKIWDLDKGSNTKTVKFKHFYRVIDHVLLFMLRPESVPAGEFVRLSAFRWLNPSLVRPLR